MLRSTSKVLTCLNDLCLDFDGDDMLGVGDIKKVVQCLIGEQNSFNDNDLKRLVQKIFEEVDFDDDGALSFSEFEHVTDMCPDFLKLVFFIL